MAGYEHILDTYGSIAAKSSQMLNAAKNNDWDSLIALEQDCRALTETLKRVDDGTFPADGADVQRKADLIRKVLADDAEIRNITEPWMAQLQNIIGSTTREQRLRQAYGSSDGG